MPIRILSTICLVVALSLVVRPAAVQAQEQQGAYIQGRTVADNVLNSLTTQGVGALAAKPLDTIIAEGDSWFAYPGLDVLGAFAGGKLAGGVRYSVYSAAHAGDTVESMAYDGEQIEGFAAEFFKVRDAIKQGTIGPVRAILLSGGGNDLAGREFHILLNHVESVTGPVTPLDGAVAGAFIERIARSLESLIGTSQRLAESILGRKDIPVLIHGYAPPVPDGRPFLIGWPLPGPWLQPGFAAKGYVRGDSDDLRRNAQVMADLIDRFNKRIAMIPTNLQGRVDVRYVPLSGLLSNVVTKETYKADWSNELHPRDAAFIRVAEAFRQRINK